LGASATATAHYKTTDTTHSGNADGNGVADLLLRISQAAPGYTVAVDVWPLRLAVRAGFRDRFHATARGQGDRSYRPVSL
jgi:hypothetical protein